MEKKEFKMWNFYKKKIWPYAALAFYIELISIGVIGAYNITGTIFGFAPFSDNAFHVPVFICMVSSLILMVDIIKDFNDKMKNL